MEKIKFKNRFRIIGPDKKPIRINTTLTSKGHLMYVEGFDTLEEAQSARAAYCAGGGLDVELFPIQTYSEQIPHMVRRVSAEADKYIARHKIFSGKGLELNTVSRPKDERKYTPGKWYGKDVRFAESTQFNKGISLVHKLGDNKRKERNRGLADHATFKRVSEQPDQAAMSLDYNIVDSLRKRKFQNLKEIKTYLKSKGFKVRQINRLIPQILESRKP